MAPVRLFNSHVLYIGTLYLSQLQSFYDATVTKSALDETAFLRTKTVVSGKSKAHYSSAPAQLQKNENTANRYMPQDRCSLKIFYLREEIYFSQGHVNNMNCNEFFVKKTAVSL